MHPSYFFFKCLRVLLLLLITPAAWSCAICAPSAEQNSLVFRLFAAQSALLGEPTTTPNSYQPLHMVKGTLPSGLLIPSDKLPNAQSPTQKDVVLLLQNTGTNTWLDAGVVPLERLNWLRRLAALRPTSFVAPTDPVWPERVQLFVQDLEHPIALLAQTAYDEIAVAPYTVMRTLQPALDAKKLNLWLQAPELSARRSLYNLLWGFAGNTQTAEALEKRIQATGKGLNKADLSSMLAALLELRADAAVQWIEKEYFHSEQRTDVELQSAILALAVHGNDEKKISRERVVQSFAVLVKNNPSRAGLVASDLGNWSRWRLGFPKRRDELAGDED